jgi:xanthine/uracil/vitamin C permease (AzgA family)
MRQALGIMISLVCIAIVFGIVRQYHNYFPPNFAKGFLEDRHLDFWGVYSIAFYLHIVLAPVTMFNGLFLVQRDLRNRYLPLHRRLGKIQVYLLLGIIAPSGMIMAILANSSPWACAGFFSQGLALVVCTLMGWRKVVQRQIPEHQRWMIRCLITLAGAIVLRLMAFVAEFADWPNEIAYPISAWLCWIMPLIVYELWSFKKHPIGLNI